MRKYANTKLEKSTNSSSIIGQTPQLQFSIRYSPDNAQVATHVPASIKEIESGQFSLLDVHMTPSMIFGINFRFKHQ